MSAPGDNCYFSNGRRKDDCRSSYSAVFYGAMMNAMLEEVRKFGLEHCDLPTMLSNVAVLLRVLTVNIENNYNEGIPFYYYIITIVTAACYFYVFLFSMAWFVFWRCNINEDLVAAMIVLSLGITSEIGTLKLIYMCLHIDKFKKIAEDHLACDSQMTQGSRFHLNLLKALRNVKKRAIIYWMVLIVNGILYILKPVFLSGRNLPENCLLIYGLEPMFESPNYEIAYFMMIASVFFICYVPANVTAYLIVITGYNESQILALSEEMLLVWPDAVKQAEEEMKINNINEFDARNKIVINKFVERRLKQIIVRHALIISLFNKVEDIFKGAVAMGFILLILGLIAELLGKLENTYLQLPFAFMQVAMDCFTGQRLIDASVVFEQAVYDCQWENFNKANMKMVLVMVQNSQRTMALSAGGIAQLRFSSLMSITRSIYSAYTALRSTLKD